MGHQLALPAGEDSSKPRENLKAAFKQANHPVYSALTGSFKPGEDVPMTERLAKLMGPVGFKYTEKVPSELAAVYDLADRLREVHDMQRREAKHEGDKVKPDIRLNILQAAETSISNLERQRHKPGLSEERRADIRAQEIKIAARALKSAQDRREMGK